MAYPPQSFAFLLFLITLICLSSTIQPPNLVLGEMGHEEVLGGLKAYVNGSPRSKRAIILASDVFGYAVPNFRRIADKVAAAGYFGVAPDFFLGDPFVPGNPKRPQSEWLKDHRPEKGFDLVLPVLKALKNKGFASIGAAGFCWGGKLVVMLTKKPLVNASVFLHPNYVTDDDISAVSAPISILGGELDHITPPAKVKNFEKILKAKREVPSFVKIFPGVGHGWTVIYNTNNATAVRSANEAHQDMLNWFKKYMK